MAVVAAAHIAPGKVTIGLCDGRCVWELSNGADASTAAHECAHLADMNGGSYRAAIDLLTPPNPSEHMRKRLASMEWVNAQGPNYWRTIGDRWGKSAVGHPDILARIYPPP